MRGDFLTGWEEITAGYYGWNVWTEIKLYGKWELKEYFYFVSERNLKILGHVEEFDSHITY